MRKNWFRRLTALLLVGALFAPALALAEDAVEIDAAVEEGGYDEFAEVEPVEAVEVMEPA